VSIKATTTRPFDTESAGDYTATGFVISKEHGLILSNRHVVNPAPITCVAVFVNYEEIPIWPVYRDPIHDFGIFRYDPEKLKHIKVEEIELHPDAAHVGEDIRVVGNDAGEKLSVGFVIRR
jgi:S1-C subfamily serine protease